MALTTSVRVTASGEVGTSGKRKHLYAIHLAAGAAAASRAIFHNGTVVGDPALAELAAVSGSGDGQALEGSVYDKGLYVELSGAGAVATVEFVEQG